MGVHKNLKERTTYGEKIGGGYIVMRRHTSSGRVAISPVGLPFEYPTLLAAMKEATRLATFRPGKQFCVFQEVNSILVSDNEATPPDQQSIEEKEVA